MRSTKVGKEPRGRRFRTPRRKARCLTARLSRRCPSSALVAWGGAVTPVMGKDVAARFRRGDVLLKPQHEPGAGNGTQGLDDAVSYPEQVVPASSCGTIRALTRGENQVMADGARPEPLRRADGLATSATLELQQTEQLNYRLVDPRTRRCLEDPLPLRAVAEAGPRPSRNRGGVSPHFGKPTAAFGTETHFQSLTRSSRTAPATKGNNTAAA